MYLTFTAECGVCGHQWVAVIVEEGELHSLECPLCGCFSGEPA